MNEKTYAGPGYGTLSQLYTKDALVRSVMDTLEDVRMDCDDALSAADRLETVLKRFLAHVDALPPKSVC